MKDKEQTSIQEIIGRHVEMLAWSIRENISLELDNNTSFEIPSEHSFWRILNGDEIIITVDDFFVKTNDAEVYEIIPISDAEYEQFEDVLDSEDHKEALFAYLDEVFDKRIKILRRLLEGTTVINAVENGYGDFKLSFSSGLILEAFANSYQKDSDYLHLYRVCK